MGFKLVFLWTDLALWVLFAALAGYGWNVSRQPPLRATWAQAMRSGATLGAAAVLALFDEVIAGVRASPAISEPPTRLRWQRQSLSPL